MWITHNYSHSPCNSTQNQLFFFEIYNFFLTLVFESFWSLRFATIFRKTFSVSVYAICSACVSHIHPLFLNKFEYGAFDSSIGVKKSIFLLLILFVGIKMIEIICCDKNLNFSLFFVNFLVSCNCWDKRHTVTIICFSSTSLNKTSIIPNSFLRNSYIFFYNNDYTQSKIKLKRHTTEPRLQYCV